MIKTYHSISVRYGSYTKRFQWKRPYTPSEFSQVLADLFQIKNKILGLQDQEGNLYDLSYLCHNPNEILPEVYTLLVQGGGAGHRATASASTKHDTRFMEDHLYANNSHKNLGYFDDTNFFYGSQEQGKRFNAKSDNFRQALSFPIGFVSDLQNFKTIFLSDEKGSDFRASILFLFEDNQEKRVILEKFSAVLEDYVAIFDYFFSFVTENDQEDERSENTFIPAPCFIIYLGCRKLLEMSLDIGENTLERIFLKLSRELPRQIQPALSARSNHSFQPLDKKERFTNQFTVKSQEKVKEMNIQPPIRFDDFEIENFERISKDDINKKQERYIQLANDLEKKAIVDSTRTANFKTRILDEDPEVYKEIDELSKLTNRSERKAQGLTENAKSTGKAQNKPEATDVPSKKAAQGENVAPQRSKAENLAWLQNTLNSVAFKIITKNEEKDKLNHLALSGHPIILAVFQVYELNHETNDLIENLQMLLKKMKKPERQHSPGEKIINIVESKLETEDEEELEQQKSPFSRQLERLEQEVPDLWNQIEDEEEAEKHKAEPEKTSATEQKASVGQKNIKEPAGAHQIGAIDSESIVISDSKKPQNSKNKQPQEEKRVDEKKHLPADKPITFERIWDFCELQKNKFKSEEFGMLLHLKQNKPNLLKDITKNAKSLEDAFDQIKGLARVKFSSFLIDNFEAEEIDTLEKNKNDSDSLIYSTLTIFKSNGNLDHFKTSIKSQLMVSNNNSEVNNEKMVLSDIPSCQSHNQTDYPSLKSTTGRFSFIAEQRKAARKASFRMNLLTTGIQELIDKEKKKEEESNLLVTLHQEEDAEYAALMMNYFKNDQDKLFLRELFEEFMKKAKYLNPNDKKMLHIFFGSYNVPLLLALQKYEKSRSAEKIKKEIQKILEREDQFWHEQESPLMKAKIKKLNQFKHLLVRLKTDLILTQKQYKLLYYLYLVEDMAVLSAFEVFITSDDMDDFTENLKIVSRMHFFKSKLDLDEIEQFDDNVEFQLGMLYAFKKYLSTENRKNLEKIIRAGDLDLLKIYNDYKCVKKKSIFIDSLKSLAREKSKAVKHMEEKIMEQKKEESNVEKRKETLETFIIGKFLKQVHQPDLIIRLIEEEHKLVDSVFEVYETTKDKADFIENVTVLYKWAYKDNFLRIIKEFKDEEKWPKRYVDFFSYVVKVEVDSIMAIYELYMKDNDRQELKESIKVAIKIFKNDIKNLERFTGPI